jgi:hypothetical protein
VEQDNQASFSGWARVEVMGHQTHIGFVKTEAYGQAVMFRIDTPGAPEREFVLESPEYAEEQPGLRRWCPAGTKVKRPARDGVTVLVGAGSIYRIVPCTEAVALHSIERGAHSPLMLVSLPEGRALPPAEEEETGELDFDPDEEDDDEDEHDPHFYSPQPYSPKPL